MTLTRALKKPVSCGELAPVVLGWQSCSWGFVPPKGAGSGKQKAASLASLTTQAHISSVRVAPKWDGGGEVTDSSPFRRVFLLNDRVLGSGRNF